MRVRRIRRTVDGVWWRVDKRLRTSIYSWWGKEGKVDCEPYREEEDGWVSYGVRFVKTYEHHYQQLYDECEGGPP